MKRVVLQERTGRQIVFESEALATLRIDDINRLTAGEEITYRAKVFRLKSQRADGTWYYTEHAPWMDKHPLIQLDMQLRGQGRSRPR